MRLIFAIMAALTVFGLAFTVPDSPYWLALRGNIPGAYCSLRAFRATSDQAARDLFQIYDVISSKQNLIDRDTTRGPMSLRLNKLMLKRWAILLTGALMMFTRGVAGRYATYICLLAYFGSEVWMQMVEGAVSMVLCALALKFLAPYFDRFRRRYMLIGLLSGMFVCATLSKFTSVEGTTFTGIPRNSTNIAFSVGFIVLHFLSEIPVALYISESFPLSYRGMLSRYEGVI